MGGEHELSVALRKTQGHLTKIIVAPDHLVAQLVAEIGQSLTKVRNPDGHSVDARSIGALFIPHLRPRHSLSPKVRRVPARLPSTTGIHMSVAAAVLVLGGLALAYL